jgi:hypothetical protein
MKERLKFTTQESPTLVYIFPNGERSRWATIQRRDGMINIYGGWGTFELVKLLDYIRATLLNDGETLTWRKEGQP